MHLRLQHAEELVLPPSYLGSKRPLPRRDARRRRARRRDRLLVLRVQPPALGLPLLRGRDGGGALLALWNFLGHNWRQQLDVHAQGVF